MKRLVEQIQVSCPRCGETYGDWLSPANEREPGPAAGGREPEPAASTCPGCGHRVRHELLAVREDGVWELDGREPED